LPQKANAGLNFYVSTLLVLSPLNQAFLLFSFPAIPAALTAIPLISIANTLMMPSLIERFISADVSLFLRGYLARALLSIGVVTVATVNILADENKALAFFLYLGLFWAMDLCHKIIFNIGWLFVMRAATSHDEANVFVAKVRRTNAVVSVTLSTVFLILLAGVPEKLALVVAYATAAAYSAWSYFCFANVIRLDPEFRAKLTLELGTARSSTFRDMVETLRDPQNLLWTLPSFLSSLLMPALVVAYSISVVGLSWRAALAVTMSTSLLVASIMPYAVAQLKQLSHGRQVLLLAVCGPVSILALSFARHLRDYEYLPYILLAISTSMGALIVQCFSLLAHNNVIFSKSHTKSQGSSFALYNVILDIMPLTLVFVASLLLPLSRRGALVTPYEILYLFGYMAALSVTLVASRRLQRESS
jgi:hypothetical protein